MERLLTTTEFALAIGASESSVRRWTDSGAIRTSRTPGRHRRIALSEAIRFIRDTRAAVVRPDVLGLPAMSVPAGPAATGDVAEELYESLTQGKRAEAHGLLLRLYLGGASLASIFDGPVRQAMHRAGELWEHSQEGILVEHRATDICITAVSALRQLLQEPDPSAPLAIGGTPPGDPYILPSAMAAAVFTENGWREANYGPRVPLDLLGRAAADRSARLVWLSVSFMEDKPLLHSALRDLSRQLADAGVPLALGGRCVRELDLAPLQCRVCVCSSMAELAEYARRMRSAAPAGG